MAKPGAPQTFVKLTAEEASRLPRASTVIEGVRLAIAIAEDRRATGRASPNLDARLNTLDDRIAALERLISGLIQPMILALERGETPARVARIETHLVLQTEGFARLLEQVCALSATVEGLALAAGIGTDRDDPDGISARIAALREEHLTRLFDRFDVEAQRMAEAVRTPGSATAMLERTAPWLAQRSDEAAAE